jgi:hypothetical protein
VKIELNTAALQKVYDNGDGSAWKIYETMRVMLELNFPQQTKDDCANVADICLDYFNRRCKGERKFYTIGYFGKLTRSKMLDYISKQNRDKKNNINYLQKTKGEEWIYFPKQLKITLRVVSQGKAYSLSM